jgi:DNA-binding CsgD family transcriptional regulator
MRMSREYAIPKNTAIPRSGQRQVFVNTSVTRLAAGQWQDAGMRLGGAGSVAASARLFERLVGDAQGATDLATFRSKLLEALAREIGADSGSMMDPPGTRVPLGRARSRIGMFSIDPSFGLAFVAHKARYEQSIERLVRAMEPGRPINDADVYERRERERLDAYAEILLPQGARALLCTTVRHRGKALCQLVLKRHGRGAAFRERDSRRLDLFLPALALADAGVQHCLAASSVDADFAPLSVDARPLGSREAEIAALVCKGMRNREIAMLIGTSSETVKKQVHSVFTKLGVSTRAELAGLFAAHRPP